jgi:DNA polymerase delta subunit 1
MIIDILETDYAPESIADYGLVEEPDVIPAILIFARTEEGTSVAIQVLDYKPWIRVELRERETSSNILVNLHARYGTLQNQTIRLPRFYGYVPSKENPNEPKQFQYLDIYANSFKEAQHLQYNFKAGNLCDNLQHWTTKFCNDLGIIPSDWIEISDDYLSDTHWSTCQQEYKVPWKNIKYIEKNSICPLKIMSFDCEMYSHDGLFPSVQKNDFTSMLCATIQSYGSTDVKKVALVVLPENVKDFPTTKDPNIEIQIFKSSHQLLEGFRDLVVREDPDILTGWNIYGFDFQFMYEDYIHATNTGLTPDTKALFCSRVRSWESKYIEQQMKSAAKGDNTYRYWKMDGRICVDLMQIIKDDKKPEDNTLKHVAGLFLDPEYGKLDLTPHEMFEAFRTGNAEGLTQTMEYCIRDAEIPLLLIQKLVYVPSWIEMSRVCFTNLFAVLNGGQQRRVFNVISRFVHNKYALNQPIQGLWPVEDTADDTRAPQYQGATVIEPITGFYQTPVSVLDFESLYPSIMIYFNLCPSVLLGYTEKGLTTSSVEHDIHEIKFDLGTSTSNITSSTSTTTSPNTQNVQNSSSRHYAFAKHIPGVLPQLLRHLLKSRKAVKALMNTSTDPFEKFVLNGRQSALKVVCNSVYGFMGVSDKKGLLPCKCIAAVTTMKGRAFIDRAKQHVEEHWPGSKVLYGDTDSIMVLWPLRDQSGNNDVTTMSSMELTPSKKPLTIAEAYENGNQAS